MINKIKNALVNVYVKAGMSTDEADKKAAKIAATAMYKKKTDMNIDGVNVKGYYIGAIIADNYDEDKKVMRDGKMYLYSPIRTVGIVVCENDVMTVQYTYDAYEPINEEDNIYENCVYKTVTPDEISGKYFVA